MDTSATGQGRPRNHQILWAEMKYISWSILRHLAIIILLTTRLLVLPLKFWSAQLNTSMHSALPVLLRSIKRAGLALLDCLPTTVKRHPVVTDCISRIGGFMVRMRQTIRIVFVLYDLGILLDENPELLRSRRASATRQLRDTRKSTLTNASRDDFTHHATASQIYHAALANDHNTLDDILAGFVDTSEGTLPTVGARRISSTTAIDCQRCQRRSRYRNSSIQTTPERMLTPLQPRMEQIEMAQELEGDPSSDNDRTVTEASQNTEISPTSAVSASVLSFPDSSTATQLAPEADDNTSLHSHGSCRGPEGCPREMAKQAQSRLPRRRSSPPGLSSQASIGSISDKKRSTATIEPLTPTRKGKLQRRPRTPRP